MRAVQFKSSSSKTTPPLSNLNSPFHQWNFCYKSKQPINDDDNNTYRHYGRVIATLTKPDDNRGLGLVLSETEDGRPVINEVLPNSPAERCDRLQAGDFIVAINRHRKPKSDDVIKFINETPSNKQIFLEVQYDPVLWAATKQKLTKSISVTLTKDSKTEGIGLLIRNALLKTKCSEKSTTRKSQFSEAIVAAVRPDSPADREGSIKVGDRILCVDGVRVTSANEYYKHIEDKTTHWIKFEYCVEPPPACPSGRAIVVEIEKKSGTSIGISLSQDPQLSNECQDAITISEVKPASIVDRCGVIQPGDTLLSINDHPLRGVRCLNEIKNLLSLAIMGSRIRLGIKPKLQQSFQFEQRSLEVPLLEVMQQVPSNEPVLCSGCRRFTQSMLDLSINNRLLHLPSTESISKICQLKEKCTSKYQQAPRLAMFSLTSTLRSYPSQQLSTTSSLSTTEQASILLQADQFGSLGFTVHCQQSSPKFVTAPIVCYVEPDGPAGRSGVIQNGDRILRINNRSVIGCSVKELLVHLTGAYVSIDFEFDVSSGISLTSGIFQVKFIKKSRDIGLSFVYAKTLTDYKYPLVVDVVKGSVAYRTGMIQTGNWLLAINGESITGRSLHYIYQLLDELPLDNIATLKFQKHDDDIKYGITYTVEVKRQGRPLGLTLATPQEPLEPMYVSGLCESGLIIQTEAVHIGDRILAVDDTSLRGKGLAEVLSLLQVGCDPIRLKIFRPLRESWNLPQHLSDVISHQTHMEDAQNTSQDSALESWIGSNCSEQLTTADNKSVPDVHRHSRPTAAADLTAMNNVYRTSLLNDARIQISDCDDCISFGAGGDQTRPGMLERVVPDASHLPDLLADERYDNWPANDEVV